MNNVIELLESAKPAHCDCGHPRCSINQQRVDMAEAIASVTGLARVSRAVLDDMNSVAPKYRAQQSVDELTAALAPFGGVK